MNVLRRLVVLAVLFSCLAGRIGYAVDEDIIEVVATGIGQDSDRALRNAFRAAIEQAVGTLVDSQTIAENDKVISDQILSYSGGFVESHKVIGGPKTVDGLVSVKIIAQVKRTELSEKLTAAAVHVSDVDGESLFGEALTKIEKNQAAGDIIKNAVKGFPANVMDIRRVDKPEYDERAKKWVIKVEISVDREKYRIFIKELLPVVEKVATDSRRVTLEAKPGRRWLNIDELGRFRQKWEFLICIQVNDARTTTIWETPDLYCRHCRQSG